MKKYTESIFQTKRWKTREVMVGSVGVGGDNPVRIQSMTTSSTRDVEATVSQVVRLKEAGCEIVRMTVQGMKEALACEEIKNRLIQMGIDVPLVADIHFYPPAAMQVADFVDKVRINPGNFVDKRASFKEIIYDDASYKIELEKIEEKFTPLVEKCKRLKRAIRIGTNHGSLSDRIMNYYGDTPSGMVESAIEFASIARKLDFHDMIFSMKASNPLVMIEAYRLLVAKMMELGWNYPLHLGVTEAGQGEDGRVKSAIGMGALLLDGLGDTVRVSLTEDPWLEMDPCKRLVEFSQKVLGKGAEPFIEKKRDFTKLEKREVVFSKGAPIHRDGTVWVLVSEESILKKEFFKDLGLEERLGEVKLKRSSVDAIYLSQAPRDAESKKKIEKLIQCGVGVISQEPFNGAIVAHSLHSYQKSEIISRFSIQVGKEAPFVLIVDENKENWQKLKNLKAAAILFKPKEAYVHNARAFLDWLKVEEIETPVILGFDYSSSFETLVIEASAECGSLLADKLGDGLLLGGDYPISSIRELQFNILQASRMRTVKTDFISCPSCGRTLFDLQEVTKEIHRRTSHLPGVKIAIMGCIVNGPGEMADADFGYVGSKPSMIDLYVGKTCVQKDIPFNEAPDHLVALIKAHGRWAEPEEAEVPVTHC